MPTRFHRRVRQILEKAVQLEPERRELFFQRACAGDAELLQEVRSLLPHFEVMQGFEPERPQDSKWMLPGTTTFTQVKAEAADAEVADEEREPPFTIDHYTALEVLGRGGMGVVYRAVHPTLHRQVALKILRKGLLSTENRQRFTFEEEVLRQLQHPGIARFVHAGVARPMPIETTAGLSDWRPYFVMEYIAGQPLTKFAEAYQLDVRQRLALVVKICEAVEYAHHRGIIHRDLKPDNILVPASGQPKILDFGIAHIPFFQSTLIKDKDGHFTGTLLYASPEQIAGKVEDLTPRSDVYTLGLIAHELLTGRLPRRVRGGVRLVLDNVSLAADSMRRRSNEKEFRYYLTAILATALRETEGEYYNSAGEVGADIESLLTHFPVRSPLARIKNRLSGIFSPGSACSPAPANRPLRAVLRKRIAMAMESGAYRAAPTDESSNGPSGASKPGPTIRLEPEDP